MKAGKDLCRGGQQKGQSQEGQARLGGWGWGAGNTVAGGLRLGGGPAAVPPAPSLEVRALQPLSPPTLALSFPVGQVTPSVLFPSLAGESKQNEKGEQAQSYEGVDLSPTAWQ